MNWFFGKKIRHFENKIAQTVKKTMSQHPSGKRSLRLEPLEDRCMLAVAPLGYPVSTAAVTTESDTAVYGNAQPLIQPVDFEILSLNDFIGTDGDWSNASNWSLGHVPTATETACLDASDSVNITNTSGVNGNILNDGTLTLSGSGISLPGSVQGTGRIIVDDNTNLTFMQEVSAGSLSVGTNAGVTFLMSASINDTVTATATSGFKVLPDWSTPNVVVTFAGTTNIDGADLFVGSGAMFTLPGLTDYTLPAGDSALFTARDGNSVLQMANLTTLDLANGSLGMAVTSGGKIDVSQLASVNSPGGSLDVSVDSEGTIDISNVRSMTLSSLNFFEYGAGSQINASSLQTIDITNGSGSVTVIGQNTVLSLNALTNVTSASQFRFQAYDAARLNMTGLKSFGGQSVFLGLSGDNSTIDLSGIQDTTLTNVSLYFSGNNLNIIGFDQVNAMSSGTITSNDGTQSLANLTSLTNVYIYKDSTGTLTLPSLTSFVWTQPANDEEIRVVQGTVTLPALVTVTVPEDQTFDATAYYGGKLNLTALENVNGRGINFLAIGAESLIDVSAMTAYDNVNGTFQVEARSGGQFDFS
ncbi:MAG: hypothetical protein FWC50_04415, partial [Planctomycetaceae bacterium]|nr:hypothetical protein [Planctomycetaceae bacterium]